MCNEDEIKHDLKIEPVLKLFAKINPKSSILEIQKNKFQDQIGRNSINFFN